MTAQELRIHYAPESVRYAGMNAEELRAAFLIESLFQPNVVDLTLTDLDRAIVGSAVTYSNASKISVLQVPESVLRTFGAVHEETASAMAEGVRRLGGTAFGLATTGIAGPSGGTSDKPVGTVCIGLATPRRTAAQRFNFTCQDRLMNKTMFAMKALDVLRRALLTVERGD